MTSRGWLKFCVVGLIFAAGLSAGLLMRRSATEMVRSRPIEPSEEPGFPTEAVLGVAEGWAPEHPLITSVAPEVDESSLGEWMVVPSVSDEESDLHPPEIALRVQLAGGPQDTFIRRDGDGPQLHPPDAPLPPSIPTRTAENNASDAPERLPLPEGAARVPSSAEDRRDARLRELIEEVLPEATEAEQDVWLEELRGINPGTARQLLELRKRLGAVRDHEIHRPEQGRPRRIDDDHFHDLANRPGRLPPAEWPNDLDESESLPPMPMATDPLSDESVITRPLESAMTALRQARGVLVHNIANSRTDGFKRTIVEFTERSSILVREGEDVSEQGQPDASFGQGTSIRTRFDFEQGPIRETGRSLDVAIDGAGWLQLKLKDGAPLCYTRCGRLQINRDRSLGIRLAGQMFSLEPRVEVPATAVEVHVNADGTVEALAENQDEAQAIGRISLAKFATTDVLVPCGGGLYKVASEDDAPTLAEPGSAGYGCLQAGCLEGSNVDIKNELAELQKLKMMSRGLMEAVRLMRDDVDEFGDQETAACGFSRACDSEDCILSKTGCRATDGCCGKCSSAEPAGCERHCRDGRCSFETGTNCKKRCCGESCDQDCCEKSRCDVSKSPCCRHRATSETAAAAECPNDNCPEGN